MSKTFKYTLLATTLVSSVAMGSKFTPVKGAFVDANGDIEDAKSKLTSRGYYEKLDPSVVVVLKGVVDSKLEGYEEDAALEEKKKKIHAQKQEELEKQAQAALKKAEEMKQRIIKLRKLLEARVLEIAQKEEEEKKLAAEIALKEKELEEAKRLTSQTEAKLLEEQELHNKTQSSSKSKVQILSDYIKKLSEQASDLKAKRMGLEAENDAYKEQFAKLTQQHEKLVEETKTPVKKKPVEKKKVAKNTGSGTGSGGYGDGVDNVEL